MINDVIVTYRNRLMRAVCDRNCGKAWGINSRPFVQLSLDEDDIAWLADGELGEAPADPGTYEGGHAKPLSPDAFPNKWCIRECERCVRSKADEVTEPLTLKDWSKRRYNKGGRV